MSGNAIAQPSSVSEDLIDLVRDLDAFCRANMPSAYAHEGDLVYRVTAALSTHGLCVLCGLEPATEPAGSCVPCQRAARYER